MIYITGDTHRDFSRLNNLQLNKNDLIIILGDAGINFCLNNRDEALKEQLNSLNVKFFCIRGNHEERPENIKSYIEMNIFAGTVYLEENYPNLLFAKDGETYNIADQSVLTIGGAYSIDKYYRLLHGYPWFSDEQLSRKEMRAIFNKVKGKHFDLVLTHTCPYKYEPREVFLPGLNQSLVDKSMEHFLDKVESNISYDKWYCGHYHTEKEIDKLEFMYENVKILKR